MAAKLANPVINSLYLKPQHEWGWQVALYLCLAGIGSGALVAGLLASWLGHSPYASKAILLWGPILVAIGASFLILKLGIKRRFLNTIRNPRTSWLSRGFYILSVCIITGSALLVIALLPSFGVGVSISESVITTLEIITFVFALATAVYTGILIQAVKYVSFWHTYLLPALFTVSSLSTGATATILATSVYDRLAFSEGYSASMRHFLLNSEQFLLIIEAVILFLFLYSRYRVEEGQARNSVRLLLFGRLRLVFWLGIVLSGLILPLVLEVIYSGATENPALLYATGGFVLLSGFLLRLGIIYAGIKDETPLYKYVELQYYLRFPDTGSIPLTFS